MKKHTFIVRMLLSLALIISLSTGMFAVPVFAFDDVREEHWYSEAVNWCRDNNIMSGTEPNKFSPDTTMTRAMLAAVLYRAAESPEVKGTIAYNDAIPGSWYVNALIWASENNIMGGYGNGLFGVNDPISREQMAAVLWRQQGSPEATGENSFTDKSDISNYAVQAVQWAHNANIIGGIGGNRFNPKGNATRAEVATVLYRALKEKVAPTPTPTPTTPTPTPKPPTTPTPTPTPPTTTPGALQTSTYDLNVVEFKMILVEGGTFTMGNNERAAGGGTQVSNQKGEHEVTLSSFLIGETEVTRALWNEVMNGSHSSNDLNYPVASVTVPDCRDFVKRLNEKAHAAGIIPDDMDFHMLTEAQWEFAAKGGNQSKGYVYAGSDDLSEVGWTSSDGSSVHMVKQKKANELGIYDMSGNVYEWVADYAAPYSTEAQTDPFNLTPSNDYIKRGGSFYYNDHYRFTTTYRYFYSATDNTIGLRIGLY